jgi:hypothetical protein
MAARRRLPLVVCLDDYRPDDGVAGIGAEEDCVCGSHRKARSCHQARDRSWTDVAPEPLLAGAVTGYANPRCYGRSSNDCSEKVSREHWISAGIQRCIMGDGSLMWKGMPWLAGETREVSVGSGASRVLCMRHNVALSPLDAMAETVFRRISEGQVSLATEDNPRNEFTLCSGPLFERWLLKVLWGGVASRSFGQAGVPLEGLQEDADLPKLADALWRGGALLRSWGFHSMLHQEDPKGPPESIGIQPFSSNDRLVYGAAIDIGALRVIFTFESPDYTTHYRRQGFGSADKTLPPRRSLDSIGQKLDIHSLSTFGCRHQTRDDARAGAIGGATELFAIEI